MKNLWLVGLLLIALALGCGAPQNSTSGSNPSNQQQATISKITWNDYDNIYNTTSHATDMQKDQAWPGFKDKVVAWSGTVEDVQKGTFGGVTVNIKMNKDTLTSDIMLKLKSNQASRASSLSKGSSISFVGTLRNYGGAIMPLSMDEGEIK